MNVNYQLFKTGIPFIDQQHQAYLDMVERLIALCSVEPIDPEKVKVEVRKVVTYAVEHFDNEEQVMLSLNYPFYEEHKAKHNVFRGKTDGMVDTLDHGKDITDYTFWLTKWLVDWVFDQIHADDVKLAKFLRTKESQAV